MIMIIGLYRIIRTGLLIYAITTVTRDSLVVNNGNSYQEEATIDSSQYEITDCEFSGHMVG